MSGSGGVSVRAGPSPRLDRGRAQLRRLQRRALQKGPPKTDPLDPEHAGFVCAVVCGNCGQLQWPDQGQSPHRRDLDARPTELPPCSHCGDSAWIDLANESMTYELRKSEGGYLPSRPSTRTAIGIGAAFLPLAALAVYLGSLQHGFWYGVAVACGMFSLATYGYVRLMVEPYLPDRALPARWNMVPLPELPKGEPKMLVGRAQATGELLTAPLTGRPCLAYEVGIRDDREDLDAYPGWTLLEQRVAPFEIQGKSFDGKSTTLLLPHQHLGHRSELELEQAAKIYLRQRGFSSTTPAAHVYESIVPANAEVTVTLAPKGTILCIPDADALPAADEPKALAAGD